MDHTAMAEDYLKRDIPVIVTDAMNNWPAKEKFNVQFLAEVCITVSVGCVVLELSLPTMRTFRMRRKLDMD